MFVRIPLSKGREKSIAEKKFITNNRFVHVKENAIKKNATLVQELITEYNIHTYIVRPLTGVSIPAELRTRRIKSSKRVIRNKAIQGGRYRGEITGSTKIITHRAGRAGGGRLLLLLLLLLREFGRWTTGIYLIPGEFVRAETFPFPFGSGRWKNGGRGEEEIGETGGGRKVEWREMKKDEYTREEHRETRTANNRDLCGSGDRKVYKRKRDIAKGGDRWMEKRERKREKNGGVKRFGTRYANTGPLVMGLGFLICNGKLRTRRNMVGNIFLSLIFFF